MQLGESLEMNTVCTDKEKKRHTRQRALWSSHLGLLHVQQPHYSPHETQAAEDAVRAPKNQWNEEERHFSIVRTSWNNPIALCPRQGNWAHRLSMFPKALSSSSIKILNSSNRSWGMWFMWFLIHPGMTSLVSIAPVVFSPITTHWKLSSLKPRREWHIPPMKIQVQNKCLHWLLWPDISARRLLQGLLFRNLVLDFTLPHVKDFTSFKT